MLQRPQPLGVFPLPAGLLLLPSATGPAAAAAGAIVCAGGVPDEWPAEWAFFATALAGDRDGAAARLAHDASPVAAYNRFVLTGDAASYHAALDASDATLTTLAALAAYAMGDADVVPEPDGLDGELRAHALVVRAAAELEQQRPDAAAESLRESIDLSRQSSPLAAAQALAQLADLTNPDDPEDAIRLLAEAASLASAGQLSSLTADLQLRLALALHQGASTHRPRLVDAINAYQAALRAGVTVESAPDSFAVVQNNLGLAFAAMPMTAAGDTLRLAVAVQSFREALKVYSRESHPEEWASTMLNMANALQYMPSSHPQENLIEAVNTYEEILGVRNKAFDPVGYARVLANQANALAHLGMFAPALEKLNESHKLLHWHGEPQSAQALLEQVERVNAQMALAAAGGAEGAAR